MNPAALCLAAAGLVGLAAAWLGTEWLRMLEVALPLPHPAASWAVPCVTAAAAVGAALAARWSRQPLQPARRALALGAAAVLCATPPAAHDVPDLTAAVLAVLPAAVAAACMAAGLVRLGTARRLAGRTPTGALGGVLSAGAVGLAVGFAGVTSAGASPGTTASIALLAASLLCGRPWTTPPDAGPRPAPGRPATRERGPLPRVALVSPCLAGFALALSTPAIATLIDQWAGAARITRTDLGQGLAVGAVLAGLLPGVYARRAVGVRGYSMMGLALALTLVQWIPGVVLESLSGARLAWTLGLPVGFCATGLIVVGARAGRVGWVTRAGPLSLAACGATAGALWPLLSGGVEAGTALRGTATLAAILSVPASLDARPPGPSFSAWARRWTASGVGVALVFVMVLGSTPVPAWRNGSDDRRLLRMEEDPRGVVSLVETADGGVRLGLDNRTLLPGTVGTLLGQRMARLAAALAPDARSALVLGLGDGQLPAELATLLPGTVTCVERVGRLVGLAEDLPWSRGPDAPRPMLEHDEPLGALLARRGECELIVTTPEEPGRPGAGERLSREHFRVMRRALVPDGVAVQWLPLHAMPWPAFASAVQAFLESFPDARLFAASLQSDLPLVALVGGLGDGVPGAAAIDARLAPRPSPAGILGAPDVHDLHLADGWTLLTRLRDAPAASVEQPWPERLSMRRLGDAAVLARINSRLLADIAVPLDTASMRVRPAEEQADRQLGMELVARSAAASALLAARAMGLELRESAAGGLSADERLVLEDAWHVLLVQAWNAAPGHLDARQALLDRSLTLTRDGRWERAAGLLDAALAILPDGVLLALQSGVLLKLDLVDEAVRVGREAVARVPGDRTALLNCGSALLFARADDEAHAMLSRAREAFVPQALPPLHIAALGLLEGDADSAALARALVERLPATEPWADVLRRLLERTDDGGD